MCECPICCPDCRHEPAPGWIGDKPCATCDPQVVSDALRAIASGAGVMVDE